MDLIENLNIENDNFFNNFGQMINSTIEAGMRAILPDFIENDAIDIKNTLVTEGIPETINKTIGKVVDVGKNAIGLIKDGFESVQQIGEVINKGDLINGISGVLDVALDIIEKKNILSKDATKLIKDGKDIILNNVSNNVKEELSVQEKNINKLDNYNNKWKEAFENQDINLMDKAIKKISSLLENIAPIEKIINESKRIENVHAIIKNNGNNFNITKEDEELAKLLK